VGQEQLHLPEPVADDLDRIGQAFLADVLEIEVARRPANLAAWFDLGNLCTRLGRIRRGLEVDREIVRRDPLNPTAHYNLACSLALSAEPDAAFTALEKALELGYDDADFLEQDPDLGALRGDPRFAAFLERLRA
jgi:tetratricopeptide (TPR) repeat protein